MNRTALWPVSAFCVIMVSSIGVAAQMTPTPGAPSGEVAVTQEVSVQPLPPIAPTFDPALLPPRQLEALPLLINARNDIELLADTWFSSSTTRPEGWVQALDVNDPQLAVLLRLNLEILAGLIYGPDVRPEGWFGAVFSTPMAIARDIRHDTELIADRVVGSPTIRPAGWAGADPLMRCDRDTQALVTLVERAGFAIEVDFSAEDACAILAFEAARFAESELIQPDMDGAPAGVGGSVEQSQGAPADSGGSTASGGYLPFRADSPFVVAFLDRSARQRAGVLPEDTGFRPLNRSATEFSNMMLIGGENFSVWVDYTTTPVSTQQFFGLTPIDGEGGTYCEAAWCDQIVFR